MIPSEYSSGSKQRLGALSKQGNALLRFLWCEATRHAVVRDPALRRFYRRKLQQKGFAKAKVAAARKFGIRLWIMLRDLRGVLPSWFRTAVVAVVSVWGCLAEQWSSS
jgi:transposase